MPKIATPLGPLAVSRLKGEGGHPVGGVPGLYLKIDGGSRSWVLRVVVGNFIVLLGYDAASAKPVYQARVKVESRGKRIEQVGARVLDALMADLSKPGANIEPLRLSLGDL